jgi:hypothetical protein
VLEGEWRIHQELNLKPSNRPAPAFSDDIFRHHGIGEKKPSRGESSARVPIIGRDCLEKPMAFTIKSITNLAKISSRETRFPSQSSF